MVYGIQEVFYSILNYQKHKKELRNTEFYALKDISFNLKEGESLGFIGHNGAGKTTTLKIINGLIKPDAGSVSVKGKVGALIALGAGFNPVLSGRENIKISAAAIGYSESEVMAKMQTIIDFSEIGSFIDSPVQNYSSGMLARLGFSVAIHTRPDILLVDEVLAVGDLGFVIKCYKKIQEYKDSGGAVILVSHNIYNIRANCNKVLWIESGEMKSYGDANTVCDAYEDYVADKIKDTPNEYISPDLKISEFDFTKAVTTSDFKGSLRIEVSKPIENFICSISIFTLSGVNVSSISKSFGELSGNKEICFSFNEINLTRGTYYLNIVFSDRYMNNQLLAIVNKYKFKVVRETTNIGAGLVELKSDWVLKNC